MTRFKRTNIAFVQCIFCCCWYFRYKLFEKWICFSVKIERHAFDGIYRLFSNRVYCSRSYSVLSIHTHTLPFSASHLCMKKEFEKNPNNNRKEMIRLNTNFSYIYEWCSSSWRKKSQQWRHHHQRCLSFPNEWISSS